jgi:HAMP domain-containing protein
LRPDAARADPKNLLRARPLTQLIGPDGERYTFMLLPARGFPFANRIPVRGFLFLLALIISALVSYLLARAMSLPVRRLRDAAHALADGNLDSRVAASVGRSGR